MHSVGELRGLLWPRTPSQAEKSPFPQLGTIKSENKGRKPPFHFIHQEGLCPFLIHCLTSHQMNICKMKDLYSVKYFTCHHWELQVPRLYRGFPEGFLCSLPHRQSHTAPKWLLWRSRKPTEAAAKHSRPRTAVTLGSSALPTRGRPYVLAKVQHF